MQDCYSSPLMNHELADPETSEDAQMVTIMVDAALYTARQAFTANNRHAAHCQAELHILCSSSKMRIVCSQYDCCKSSIKSRY